MACNAENKVKTEDYGQTKIILFLIEVDENKNNINVCYFFWNNNTKGLSVNATNQHLL